MDINALKEQFTKYVYTYDILDEEIAKKYYHSLRVMDISRQIALDNKLSSIDIELASIIGLLHDYSRFEQWDKFHTYNDTLSIDHGDLAILRLFKEYEIKKYYSKEIYYDIIYDAIKYHNKYTYPKDLKKSNELHCKIIRDADKLDILQMGISTASLKDEECSISQTVSKLFFENKPIDYHYTTNKNETIILYLAMIFDLNYTYSYRYLKEHQIIEKIYAPIKNKSKFKKYFDHINKYVDERIDENVRN